ncbi:MAG TPA: tetratricopeptide repeat protein, partial [Chroococcales cyanobacterium]
MRKIANCLFASALVPFLAAPLFAAPDPFWPRLEDMVARHAYPLALYEINHAARPDAEKTHLDYLRGYCLRRLGRDSEKTLDGIPRSSVWFLPARIELSESYLSSGKTEKAAETLSLAVSIAPGDARIERLADIYFVLGKYEKAAEYYEKLSKRKPAFLYSLAWCHTRLGNYPKAMATWQTAISRLPGHP